MYDATERTVWTAESALHIRCRSDRYPHATDIDPAWTEESIADPDRLVEEPDPRSVHGNGVRLVGYSPTANMVLTVVALRDRDGVLHGASAWKARVPALRQYWEAHNG